jgi:formylglycine-generating enzyme required for sulfatase activity
VATSTGHLKGIVRVRVAAVVAASLAAALCAPSAHAQGACGADVNRNGIVDSADLGLVLSAWGSCSQCFADFPSDADINRDLTVDSADLGALLASWGATCTVPTWATVLEYTPPATVVTNPALRAAIAATGRPWRVRMTATPQIEMLLVPPGTFQMGCSPSLQLGCAADESPVHTVTLTNAFYLGRYELTQNQWMAVMVTNGSYFRPPNYPNSGNRPAENISWNMAKNFCSGLGLRLPTEAEWEYAYRAGTTTAYHSMPGNLNGTDNETLAGNIGWSELNSGMQTHDVGQLAPNGLGFHDMAGNVKEWCNDWFGPYSAKAQTNPTGGPSTSGYRVLRGGAWNSPPYYMRSSKRSFDIPTFPYSWIQGLRVARNP